MPLARPHATAFSRRARRHAMNTKRAHRSRARTTPPRARRARDTRATTRESIAAKVTSAARGSIGNPRPRSRARRVRRASNARRTRARIRVRSFAPPCRSSFRKSRTSRRRTGVDRGGEREAGGRHARDARGVVTQWLHIYQQTPLIKKVLRQHCCPAQKSVFESVLTTSARTAASPAAMTSPWYEPASSAAGSAVKRSSSPFQSVM